MLSFPHPTFPLPLPVWERKGGGGRCGLLGVLRNTDAEPVATLFQHVAETHAFPPTFP